MISDEEVPLLSVGIIQGDSGSAASLWGDAAMGLSRRVEALLGGRNSPLHVNVIYAVPGSNMDVDFTGVRTGYYSRKHRALIVQAAIPNTHEPDADVVLLDLLDQAIDAAEQLAMRRKLIREPLEQLRSIAQELRGPISR